MEYKLPPLPNFEEWCRIISPSEPGTQIASVENFVKAYAIAAIEAQGVQAFRTSFAYDVGFKDGQQAAKKSDGCGRCADGTKPCDITGSSCAADAIESQASAVQHEPVAWIRPSGKAMLEAGGYCTVYASDGMSNHSTPLYTHPAQQAKPQPLSESSVLALYQKYGTSRLDGFTAAIRDAEAAHGIQGS